MRQKWLETTTLCYYVMQQSVLSPAMQIIKNSYLIIIITLLITTVTKGDIRLCSSTVACGPR